MRRKLLIIMIGTVSMPVWALATALAPGSNNSNADWVTGTTVSSVATPRATTGSNPYVAGYSGSYLNNAPPVAGARGNQNSYEAGYSGSYLNNTPVAAAPRGNQNIYETGYGGSYLNNTPVAAAPGVDKQAITRDVYGYGAGSGTVGAAGLRNDDSRFDRQQPVTARAVTNRYPAPAAAQGPTLSKTTAVRYAPASPYAIAPTTVPAAARVN